MTLVNKVFSCQHNVNNIGQAPHFPLNAFAECDLNQVKEASCSEYEEDHSVAVHLNVASVA